MHVQTENTREHFAATAADYQEGQADVKINKQPLLSKIIKNT